jgi:hypothetical protein
MRVITQNPEKVIPNVKESDINNCLILALLGGGRKSSFVIQYKDEYNISTFNWFGEDNDHPKGYQWYFKGQKSLIEFLIHSWNFWSIHGILKIYILESIKDVDIVCSCPPLVGTPFAKVVRNKYNSLRQH